MPYTSDIGREKTKSDPAGGVATVLLGTEEAQQNYFVDALRKLWSERRFIFKAGCTGLAVATVIAFLTPSRYDSTTRLMPPDSQSSGSATLAMLSQKAGEEVGSLASGLLDMGGSGALFIGVLQSDTVRDRLVQRFDLRHVYRARLERDARDELARNTAISEDRKSGIISLTVTDKSPQRAAALARSYVEELDKLTAELTTSAAHRERVFLEGRLADVKQQLDADSKVLSDFSSKNSTLDVEAQGKAMVTAAATLEGQLIATEAQLGSLKQIYSDNNYRVRELQAQASELRRQLVNMVGIAGSDAASGDNTSSSSGMMVPINKLPKLGLTYYDLLRNVKLQEAIFETLTKQYELAKVEEAKEIPVVRVLDPANVPERKSSPHRLVLMMVGLLLGATFGSSYLLLASHWQSIGVAHPTKILSSEVKQGFLEDYQFLRARIPKLKRSSNGNATSSNSSRDDEQRLDG